MTHRKSYPGQAIPYPKGKRREKPDADQGPESLLQSRCEQYCNLAGVEWFHLPAQTLNAAFHGRYMTGPEQWAARNASAQIKGFPDLILFYRKMFYKAVELKSATGVISAHQFKWSKRLGGEIVYKFDTFKGLVDAWKLECDRILEHGKDTP